MKRTIGLWGVVATLVGFVIGAAVFLLPGELAAIAGPGVIISYALASIVVSFSCIIAAFISGVVPVSGASFIYSTKMTGPFIGFLMIWSIIAGVAMSVAFVANGFAEYFGFLLPGGNHTLIAILIVLVLGTVNILGAVTSVKIQTLLVITFVASIATFTLVGTANIKTEYLTPFIPNGASSILTAAVPAFFSFGGFLMIIDIGGEIKKPSRTIPLGLLISFLLVLICYSGVSLAIVGNIPWQQLANVEAPFSAVASIIFPGWGKDIITYAILAATATTINGLLLAYSRSIYVLSEAGIFPSALSKLSKKNQQPVYAVVLLTATSILCISFGAELSEYATLVVVVLSLTQIVLGIATLRLPKIMPQRLTNLEFHLNTFWRVFFSIGLIAFSSAFIYIGLQGKPQVTIFFALYLLLGSLYYLLRKLYLKRQGHQMSQTTMDFVDDNISPDKY